MTLGRRGRFALKIAGYALLALITFVYAIHLTFPYERLRDKLVEQLSSKYDVTIAGVERSLVPGRFALTGVTLASRPPVAGQPVTTMYFKRVEVDLKLLPLLGKRMVAGLDVSTGQGSIVGSVEIAGTTTIANFKLKHVPLATLPGISDAVGLPMDGNADGKLSLRLPKGDWSKAVGSFDLGCKVGCAVGDGVTKIYPKPQRPSDAALYRDGLTVPKILIDRFAIVIEVAKGNATLKSFELVSQDGKVEIDFTIKLARTLPGSTINGCIRYQCLPDFQRKYPGLCIGSPIVDEQGMLNVKLTGPVTRIRRLPQRCDTGGSGDGGLDNAGGAPSRPTLDTIPEPVPELTPVTPTPMPPPPEPPPIERKPMADDVNGVPPPMPSGSGSVPGAAGPTGSTGSTGVPGSLPPPPTTPTPATRSPSGAPIGSSPGAMSPGAMSPGAMAPDSSGSNPPQPVDSNRP